MKQVMSGLKNTAATSSRGHRGVSLSEGKEPLPFEVYCSLLRKWRQEDGSNESTIFGHCFLTLLTWNLMMCRSKNTVFIQREHIGWSGDAMTIQFAHSKTDREGQKMQETSAMSKCKPFHAS
jgi:hypothetical protein